MACKAMDEIRTFDLFGCSVNEFRRMEA